MTGAMVVVPGAAVPPWALRIERRAANATPPAAELRSATSVWIDGTLEHPLEVARRIHGLDPTVQIGLVAADEDRPVLERRLIFTPGLGEIWVVSPDDVNEGLIRRAGEVTRTRRAYLARRGQLTAATRELGTGRTRAVVTDAFLAALLRVLPDPVVSVDEQGEVVTWSAAAERLTGVSQRRAVGRALRDLLVVEPPESLQRLLDDSEARTARAELRLMHEELGERVVEAIGTPVEAEGFHVRVIVLRDLTGERRTQAELRSAMDIRSRFLASMSHEIRTPINAILGYNDLLLSGALGPIDSALARHLERSQAAARHLLELVNDVLDLSKIEAGKIDLKLEDVRAVDLMDDLAATLQPLAEQHETPLEQECRDPELRLRTDPRRVKQILLNLVSNAVKFGEQRPVSVRCLPKGEEIWFEVEDRGAGIAEEDQQRIFEEFVQASASEGGTGLGLPISLRLAQLLGGTLTVDSEPGRGSTFRLALSIRGPEAEPHP